MKIGNYEVFATLYFYEMKQPKRLGAVRLTQSDTELYLGPIYIIISKTTSRQERMID